MGMAFSPPEVGRNDISFYVIFFNAIYILMYKMIKFVLCNYLMYSV